MKVPGRVLIGVAAWLVVVLLGSTLVWGVISRAGEEVVSGEPTTPEPTTSSPPTSSAPTSQPPTTTGSPEPRSVRRTWSGPAGVVIARCTGAAASLDNAVAHSGWRTEVDDFGPRRVEVEFEATGEGEDAKIRATCADGEPVFEVDAD